MAHGSSNKRPSSPQPTPAKRQRPDDSGNVPPATRHFLDTGIWKTAPVLTGSTKFDPLPDCKNILITGGAGFIACWLVRHLTLTYPHYNIISFDKLDYCASLNNTRCLTHLPNFTFIHGDITSAPSVSSALRTHNIDTIFHFAAQSHVDLSFGNSYEFTNTNVFGTHVLLECARELGTQIKRFVHVSTDEVYGEVEEGGEECKEGALLRPTNPYAASKAAAEMLVHSYWKSFSLPVVVVRSNNIYGPHQFPEKVIPKFTLALARRLPLLLHGDGLHTRRYLFASDASDAFDTILHRGVIGCTYNVGSTDEVSNLALCRLLLSRFGHDVESPEFKIGEWVKHTRDRPFNDRRYAVDATRLRELGWRQKVGFEEGLGRTVEWYRAFGEGWWGDVGVVVGGAFPVVKGGVVVSGGEEAEGEGEGAGGRNGAGVKKTKKSVLDEKRNGVESKKHSGENGVERKHVVKSDINTNGTSGIWDKRNGLGVKGTRVQV